MRILVIASAPAYMSPSVKEKGYAAALRKAGLPTPTTDLEREPLYLQAVPGYARRAREAYGGYFRCIMKGVEDARSQGMEVAFFIISPRYGLITEKDQVLPYSASLTGKPKQYIREFSARHKVKELLSELLKDPCDLLAIVANRGELLLFHDPEWGFRIESLGTRTAVFSAPSGRRHFGRGVEYLPVRQVRTRSIAFAKYLDNLTRKTLRDFR